MARFFAFSTLFHLSLTFFRPEVPFKEDRSIYQDQAGLNDSKKSNKKKTVKFAILLDGLFIYFSLVIEPFRISASLIPF